MTTKAQLLKELNGLIEQAEKQTRLHKSSRDLLYINLAQTYLWWQKANKVSGLLDSLYKKHNIKTNATEGEENFTRVLRLVWRLDWADTSSSLLQQWSQALRKIDTDFQTNAEYYKTNAQNKIIAFIDNAGGIRKLIGPLYTSNATEPNSEAGTKSNPTKRTELTQQQVFTKHLESAELYYSAPTTKAITNISTTKHVAVTRKGYALALVRKKRNGSVEILNFIHNEKLVNEAIIGSYKRNSLAAPTSVRLLTEIVNTQALPITFEQHRSSLIPTSKIKVNGESRKQIKRLLFRVKHKDILLSENRTSCSVVVICKPNAYPIISKEDVFLNANDRRYIENAIIQNKELSFYSANDKNKIPQIKADEAYSHKLVLTNTVTDKIRGMYFYKLNNSKENPIFQADVATEREKPIWTAKVDTNWLEYLDAEFLDSWLNDFGTQVNRSKHKTIQIDFGSSFIQFKHYGENGNFSHASDKLGLTEFKSNSKSLKCIYLSKDLLPILHSLTTSEIVGKVDIAAHGTYLYITYKTLLGKYSIYIPTCSKSGKHNITAFERYGE